MTARSPFPACNSWSHAHARARLRHLPSGESFPTRDRLWRGAVLGTLAQVASGGGDRVGWVGPSYEVNDGSGDFGVLTFEGASVVGLFFAHEDQRSPWPGDRPPYDLRPYLAGMPLDLQGIAHGFALRQMAQQLCSPSRPQDEVTVPGYGVELRVGSDAVWLSVITAAFWGVGDALTATEPWPEVFEHGADLIERELMDPAVALARWRDHFDLSAGQTTQVQELYDRRAADPDGPLAITRDEWAALEHDARRAHEAWLRGTGWTPQPGRDYEAERFAWARSMLTSVGIQLLPR